MTIHSLMNVFSMITLYHTLKELFPQVLVARYDPFSEQEKEKRKKRKGKEKVDYRVQ